MLGNHSKLKLVFGEPVAFSSDYAIIGDLHLGFEEEMIKEGFNVYNQNNNILKKIRQIKKEKLILLGDLRAEHGEIGVREAGFLLHAVSQISSAFSHVVITKGNHDGGLEKITGRFKNVSLVKEFIDGGIGFLHGHALPSKALVETCDTMCISHLHPMVKVYDANNVMYKKDCWMLFDFKPSKKSESIRGIVVPKFNPYIGGTDNIKNAGIMSRASNIMRLTEDFVMV
jgi:putative SbcD/Mre11-related phosphoesterase